MLNRSLISVLNTPWRYIITILVVLPTIFLSYFGIRLYLVTHQESARSLATEKLLTTQFPIWLNKVNEMVLNTPDLRITPSEASALVDAQKPIRDLSLYLSVDSLITRQIIEKDTAVFVYNYKNISIDKTSISKGDVLYDAKYIVNNKREFLGLTHNQTGYLLMLQSALQVIQYHDSLNSKFAIFNGNLSINDAVINQRTSMIGFDKTGKYLIQLSSRMPDANYADNNNKIAVPQALHQLFVDFTGMGLLILLASFITLFLYRNVLSLLTRSNRWLTTLDKATCAIAIATPQGRLKYTNETFRAWNGGKVDEGRNLREISQYPGLENTVTELINTPGKTHYYYTTLGNKRVHSGITYDADSESFIVVDTDVSALRNRYDNELHSLKNLIKEVKELTGQMVMGKIDLNNPKTLMETLTYNNHSLEKIILFYENQRNMLSGNDPVSELINYDLEIGLGNLSDWFQSLLAPLQIDLIIEAHENSIRGTISSIELIFHNAIFNAIHAIREHKPEHFSPFIKITAQKQDDNYIEIAVTDNGTALPPHHSFDGLVQQSKGMGLKIIQAQILQLGGYTKGFITHDDGSKTFYLYFPSA